MRSRDHSERLTIAAQQYEKEKDFWLKQLSGELVKTSFPYDYNKTAPKESNISSWVFTLTKDEEFFSQLMGLSKGSDHTLNLILVAGLVILLYKYTGRSDILVGAPIYKQDTGGDFINTVLVLRNFIAPDMAFKEFILQVRETITDAVEHQNYPMEILLKKLNLDAELPEYGFPLFDVGILLENIHSGEYLRHVDCNVKFSFFREADRRRITGTVAYNRSLYEKTTIQHIVAHFIHLIQAVLANVHVLISDIEILPEEEKRKLLYEFNDTKTGFLREKNIHQWFEDQVGKTPHQAAASCPMDLSDIYDQLESPSIDTGVLEKMENCCFKQNPYIYHSTLKSSAENLNLVLLKTNRHNSIIVNRNTTQLLAFFNGKTNLKSIYTRLKKIEKLSGIRFSSLFYPMSRTDLLEVTFQFNDPAAVFFINGFTDLVKLVQVLYRAHLLELTGIRTEDAVWGESLPEKFAADDPPMDELSVQMLLEKNKDIANARVLLLGDTPGMPTTGLLYLASYLTRKGIKACCRFYDASQDYTSMKKEIETLLEKIQPRVVAISMKWFLYIARVLDVCKIIKEYSLSHGPDIKVVVGGNTASYYWEEFMKYDYIDILVRGDGEEPLLKICREEDIARIPNCVYKRNGQIIENPINFIQDETNSTEIYLSHLDEILLADGVSLFGTLFIYTQKGCAMNCFYCGGCNQAQQKIFNRKKVFRRGVAEVRKDILAAQNYTSTFQFDFDLPVKNLLDYCKEIWAGIDLSGHFCIFSTLTPPSAALIEFLSKTFKYVHWDFDITTLSQRHREQLVSLGLVKTQPSDQEIMAFMAECEKYPNIEVRLNLITGLPFFTAEDIESSKKLLDKIMGTYSCFGELHWARLHAQPGAPIVENADNYQMHSYATTFEDFLTFSRENFKPDVPFPFIEDLNYPYIYFKNDRLNSTVTNFYLEINRKVDQHRHEKNRGLIAGDNLTYDQLNQKANQLRGCLQTRGIGPGNIVGLMLERSNRIPVGILGILKAGCAYMPIDPDFPAGRIDYMLTDSSAKALVTTKSLAEQGEKSRSWDGETILLEPAAALSSSSTLTSTCQVSPANLAYVIYTSGTTGKPKGVLLTQENLINYVHWFTEKAKITENDKTMLTTSFAFDLGYTSIYTSLLNGGELHILPREIYLLAEGLIDYIKQKSITYLKLTPSLFSIIVNNPGFSAETCKTLRMAAVGGEAINVKDIETAHRLCPHMEIMNHYGPTEATIGCVATFIDAHRFEEYRAHPVIGKPIYNTNVYILDKDSNLLPLGVPGELCISGTCLGQGYLNRPALTAEKFVLAHSSLLIADRVVKEPTADFPMSYELSSISYIYRTGDLARWLPNGTIEFLGRIDKQVKIRGYRVELGEIESRLRKHPQVEDAVVVIKESSASSSSETGSKDETGEQYLCAYVAAKNGKLTHGTPEEIPADKSRKILTLERITGEGSYQSVIKRFEQQVKKSHNKIAVQSNGKTMTYDTLNQYAHRLAGKILDLYDDRYQLSESEKTRYRRQMLLYGWGQGAQEKLKSTTVFVAGAGGGASPTIMQLALVGFGTIKVCDFDVVELSNLNRQFLHDQERLGMNKALSAQLTVNKANPHVKLIPYTQQLTRENVFDMVADADIIFDMFDGPADKFVLSECAVVKGIPHIIISMTDINAYTTICHVPQTPCYHCLFDRKKLETIVAGMQNYVENYRKNPLPVVASSLFISTGTAVNEALKLLLGFKEPAYNKFFYFNQRGNEENLVYTPGYRAMTHLFSDHFLRICREQGFDWDVGWRGKFLEELEIESDPHCPLCSVEGKELRKELEAKMNAAKKTVIPPEIKAKEKTEKKLQMQTVALLLDDDIPMAAAIMGVLKSGKTSVPLTPTDPMERLTHVVEHSKSRIILTNDRHLKLAEKIKDIVNRNIKIIDMSEIDESNEADELSHLENVGISIEKGGAEPAACILYPDEPHGGSHSPASISELYKSLLQGTGPYIFEDNKKEIKPGLLRTELRDYLLDQMPDYMAPTLFVLLDRVPLTPNGKIDFKALPDPGIEEGEGIIVPRNNVEEKLAEIWAEVLGKEKDTVGIDSDFFKLGGHSLNAAVMTARIHRELNVKVSLAEVFTNPTVRALSGFLKDAETGTYHSIEPTEKKEYYPLSSSQNSMFLLWQLVGDSLSYNTPEAFTVEGNLNKEHFEQVIKMLIKRHEAFRTSFELLDNKLIQRVHLPESMDFNLGYYEISGDDNVIEQKIEEIIKDFLRPFDLAKAPLLRTALLKLPGNKHLLIYDFHHIIRDIVSTEIFIKDFIKLYEGVELPFLRLQYKDFSLWQNHLFQSGTIKNQEKYWLSVFSNGIPSLNMPLDYPRPEVMNFRGDHIEFEFGSDITRKLQQIQKKSGATPFMVVLAIYYILLSKYSGQEDIVVGSPTAGRPHADLENVVGVFLNTLAMRNYPKGEKTFSRFLEEVRSNTLKVFENQDFQFEELLSRLGIKPNPNRRPLFDTMLAWQNEPLNMNINEKNDVKGIKGLIFKSYKYKDEISQYDIIVHAAELSNNTYFVVKYFTTIFKRETIEKFTAHFREIANCVADNKHIKLKDIEISLEFDNSASDILKEAQSNFGF
ncbi:MAG: amino acid adenylation domain-containing protein [Candidatus Aminicenantes bacterium]|jgi:amino acid adenylation domain-containing protein